MDSASGPFTEEALRALQDGGAIQEDTLISSDGGENWIKLSSVLATSEVAEPWPGQILHSLWRWRKFSIPAFCILLVAGAMTLRRPGYTDAEYRKMAKEYTLLIEYAVRTNMQITEKDDSKLRFYGNLINTDPAFSAACQAEVDAKLMLEPDYARFGHR